MKRQSGDTVYTCPECGRRHRIKSVDGEAPAAYRFRCERCGHIDPDPSRINLPLLPRGHAEMGCCIDRDYEGARRCNEQTCMNLPDEKTCGDCVHETRCTTIFGAKSENSYCQFFPRRFREES